MAASIGVCALLIAVGAVRAASYAESGRWLQQSWLGFLAYQPDSAASVRYFKILSTPSVAALQYFLFRLLNRGHRPAVSLSHASDRVMDFKPLWLRIVLTTLVSANWLLIEMFKFAGREEFYPYSPLEDAQTNLVVLLVSQVATIIGMKYLAFGPLRRG